MRTYHGEKAIISLTSWKARIGTVAKTIYSLLKMCPGFHIVLVLSEEEFPKKEAELPASLMTLVNNNLVELLWVYKNYKSFKKVLFTMDKYRDVPVISADDDCWYTRNYAQELLNVLNANPDAKIICYNKNGQNLMQHTEGPCTLYNTKALPIFLHAMLLYLKKPNIGTQDDTIMSEVMKRLNITALYANEDAFDLPFIFTTTVGALNPDQYRHECYLKCLPITV